MKLSPYEAMVSFYLGWIKGFSWTQEQVDNSELEFLLDLEIVNFKNEHPELVLGNADDIAFL